MAKYDLSLWQAATELGQDISVEDAEAPEGPEAVQRSAGAGPTRP
jgi:hypothetical protein